MRPSGLHTRNRAIRYRTPACAGCQLKPRCTPGAQRTIRPPGRSGRPRPHGGGNLRRSSLMTIRRCTVEHPFGTIKRMSGGGRFLTRDLRAVKAEAALSVPRFQYPPRHECLRRPSDHTKRSRAIASHQSPAAARFEFLHSLGVSSQTRGVPVTVGRPWGRLSPQIRLCL